MPQETGASPSETLPQAKAFVARALEIDDSIAEAHATLGLINYYSWRWSESEGEFERAIKLNPNYPTAHQWYSGLLDAMGRSDDRFAEIKKAYDLDPSSTAISTNVALAHLGRRDLSSALDQCQRTLQINPNFFVGHSTLALTYLKLGKGAEALLEAQKGVELCEEACLRPWRALGAVNGGLGRRNDAMAIIREIEQKPVAGDSDKYFIASIFAFLGDRDQAFAFLEKCFQAQSYAITGMRVDPFVEPLRDDPRFKDLLRRMGLPE